MPEITMPSLGADMDEGRLLEWLVHPGDHVRRGDLVAVVDTDKSEIEIESFVNGVIGRLLIDIGDVVAVGTPIALVGDVTATVPSAAPAGPPLVAVPSGGAATAAPSVEGPPAAVAPSPAPATVAWVVPVPPAVTTPRPAPIAVAPRPTHDEDRTHSPLIRRLARHLGVDLDAVVGSGPGGRVLRADVEQAAAGGPTAATVEAVAPPPREVAPARDRSATMRAAIAALMTRSAREVPQYHVHQRIDVADMLTWLAQANLERPLPKRLVPAALLMKAVALAARATPELNGYWVDDAFVPAERVRVGVAVSLRRGGLLVPALADADTMDVDTLMAELRGLVERARAGRLRASELADPTITVTNLGDTGVDSVDGLVYPPQVALVGFGRIHDEPWAVDGMLGVRPVVHATVAGDHRASDGIQGARLLTRIEQLLHRPAEL